MIISGIVEPQREKTERFTLRWFRDIVSRSADYSIEIRIGKESHLSKLYIEPIISLTGNLSLIPSINILKTKYSYLIYAKREKAALNSSCLPPVSRMWISSCETTMEQCISRKN